jgi:hypothetical protein
MQEDLITICNALGGVTRSQSHATSNVCLKFFSEHHAGGANGRTSESGASHSYLLVKQ